MMDTPLPQTAIASISSDKWLSRKRRSLSRVVASASALQRECAEAGETYDDAVIIGLSRILETVAGLGRTHIDGIENAQRMLGQWSD